MVRGMVVDASPNPGFRARDSRFGAVSAGHQQTASAAIRILREGGNAFDAVWAAFCSACVCEPVLASLGGGGFLLTRTAEGHTQVYDAFTQTPKQIRPQGDTDFHPIHADFGAATQEFHIGRGSIATPGIVKGLCESQAQLGRLPLAEITRPAMELARDGFKLAPFQAYIHSLVAPILLASDSSRALFADGDQLAGSGHHLRNPELADTLEALGTEGANLFYKGEIAQILVQNCRDNGGHLSLNDLTSYQVHQHKPLQARYRRQQIWTNPPPSAGGLLMLFALKLLEDSALQDARFGSLEHLHTLARAMDLTNQARSASELHTLQDATQLLTPDSLAHWSAKLQATPLNPRGTTHISVIDAQGNAAALTTSNGEGCGHILPGTGIMMNNMLGEEDVNPHGFHQWPRDQRMASMMAPTLLLDEAGTLTVTGSGGSNRIRTALLQLVLNLETFGLPLDQAVSAPRIHFERGKLSLEGGHEPDVMAEMKHRFTDNQSWDGLNLFFGGTHSLQRDHNGRLSGAADPRRGGVCLVDDD